MIRKFLVELDVDKYQSDSNIMEYLFESIMDTIESSSTHLADSIKIKPVESVKPELHNMKPVILIKTSTGIKIYESIEPIEVKYLNLKLLGKPEFSRIPSPDPNNLMRIDSVDSLIDARDFGVNPEDLLAAMMYKVQLDSVTSEMRSTADQILCVMSIFKNYE